MLKLYINLKEFIPEPIKSMPLMQYSEIQGEVVKLLSSIVEATLNKISSNILTKILVKTITGITFKYKINPKKNNEEIIEIFKHSKLRTLIRFKHDRSMAYGYNTHTIIDHYNPKYLKMNHPNFK